MNTRIYSPEHESLYSLKPFTEDFHGMGSKFLYSPQKVLVTFLSYIGCFLLSLLSLADNGHMGCIHSMEPTIQLVLGVASKKPPIQIHIIAYWANHIAAHIAALAADIG